MITDFTDFKCVLDWVMAHSYFLIFLVMCLEGPITTAAAGFAAALGIFNPWIIFFLSIAGDLVPDAIYYFMGNLSSKIKIERLSRFSCKLGFKPERMKKIKQMLHENFGKTVVFLKLTPLISVMGFITIGYLRASFTKFIKISFYVTFPKSIIFLSLGYFFGQLYNINEYIKYTSIALPIMAVIVIFLYALSKKIYAFIIEKLLKYKVNI